MAIQNVLGGLVFPRWFIEVFERHELHVPGFSLPGIVWLTVGW